MKRDTKIERQLADALLDTGVSIPLFRVKLPFCRARTLRVVMSRPRLGTALRILRLYLEMDTTPAAVATMDDRAQIRFLAEHGRRLCLAIAYAVCGGFLSGRILARPLAWLIRRAVPREYIFEAQRCFIALHSTRDFMPTIAWAEAANPLTPDASRAGKRTRPRPATGRS